MMKLCIKVPQMVLGQICHHTTQAKGSEQHLEIFVSKANTDLQQFNDYFMKKAHFYFPLFLKTQIIPLTLLV